MLKQGRLEWLAPGKVNNEDDENDDEDDVNTESFIVKTCSVIVALAQQ